MVRERLRLDLPLPCNERLTTSLRAVRPNTSCLTKPHRLLAKTARRDRRQLLNVLGRKWPERGLVAWGKQLIPPGGV
jgi:hypothetical protein